MSELFVSYTVYMIVTWKIILVSLYLILLLPKITNKLFINFLSFVECIRNETILNVDKVQNQNGPEKIQDGKKDCIQNSTGTEQELLHSGCPPAKLKKEEVGTIFNENEKYLIWHMICVIYCTIGVIAYFILIIVTIIIHFSKT